LKFIIILNYYCKNLKFLCYLCSMKNEFYITRYKLSLMESLYKRISIESKNHNAFKEEYLASCLIKGAMLLRLYELAPPIKESIVTTNALLPVEFINWTSALKIELSSLYRVSVMDLYNIYLNMYFLKQDQDDQHLVTRLRKMPLQFPVIPFEYRQKKNMRYKIIPKNNSDDAYF